MDRAQSNNYKPNSKLYIPAIRLNLKVNLFLLHLYVLLNILNFFKSPITFSTVTLSNDISVFIFEVSCFDLLFFLLFFLIGIIALGNSFNIPVYPLSTIIV